MGDIKTEDKIQIEHAARGCVSGSLEEWPYLDAALRRLDVNLPLATNATALKFVCRGLVEAGAERERRERAEAHVAQLQGFLQDDKDAYAVVWAERDAARARIAALESEAGAMREALLHLKAEWEHLRQHYDAGFSCDLVDEVDAALASSAGAGVAAELEAGRALAEAVPECQCFKRKGTRVWRVGEFDTEFCDEHEPKDWYDEAPANTSSGPHPIGYEDALRAYEAARAKRGGA